MDYEFFVEEFIEGLKKSLEWEVADMKRQPVVKINEKKEALSIYLKGEDMSLVLYLDDIYGYSRGDHLSAGDMAEQVAFDLKNMGEGWRKTPELTREGMEKNLYCAVINAGENKDFLRHVPHIKMQDLAVIARYRVAKDASAVVTDIMCSYAKMTGEEALDVARQNTELQGFQVRLMDEMLRSYMKESGMPEQYIEEYLPYGEMPALWVVTDKQGHEGAAAMFSQKTMQEARKKLEEDFYILPSSRHELILVPESFTDDGNALQECVKQANREYTGKKDRLSDHVYHYDGKTHLLSMLPDQMPSRTKGMGKDKLRGRRH